MNVHNEIKAQIIRAGMTMQEVVDLLSDEYGWSDSVSNLSAKLQRESTGLNRKDFCKLVNIPYRTMTEWELDNRHAPDYVLRLLEYYIRNEGLIVKEMNDGGGDSEKEAT